MDQLKPITAAEEEAAKYLVQLVASLVPYERRKIKLQDAPNFKLAKNPTIELHIWVYEEWMPKQPDREKLKQLFHLLGNNMLEFIRFVYYRDDYWNIIEKKKDGVIPILG